MYDILQLNEMLVTELKALGDKMNLKNFKKLNKQDLIYKILDEQAISGGIVEKEEKQEAKPARKPAVKKEPVERKPRQPRQNAKAKQPKKEVTAKEEKVEEKKVKPKVNKQPHKKSTKPEAKDGANEEKHLEKRRHRGRKEYPSRTQKQIAITLTKEIGEKIMKIQQRIKKI